jgi:hypothetical protein
LYRHLLRLLPALVLTCLAVAALSGPRQAAAEGQKVKLYPADRAVIRQIHRYRRETWRWQSLMGVRRTPSAHAAETSDSDARAFRLWARNLWKHRAIRARRKAARPPHRPGWLCIHRFEGSWTDPNAPYYGGLQMDVSFQRTYGRELLRRKGTADHWTPLEQMWVAERAHRSGRGYYPWPNTARYCGLI